MIGALVEDRTDVGLAGFFITESRGKAVFFSPGLDTVATRFFIQLPGLETNFFSFFLTPFPVYCEEYTITRGLSFQVSVGHISCTIWSSSRPSTNDFFSIWLITSHIMLLPWGPWCFGQLPCPLEAAAALTPSGTCVFSK